jgi:hypothetical protein
VALALLVSIPAVIAALRVMGRARVRFASKLKYGIVGVSYLALAWISLHWHFLGVIGKY